MYRPEHSRGIAINVEKIFDKKNEVKWDEKDCFEHELDCKFDGEQGTKTIDCAGAFTLPGIETPMICLQYLRENRTDFVKKRLQFCGETDIINFIGKIAKDHRIVCDYPTLNTMIKLKYIVRAICPHLETVKSQQFVLQKQLLVFNIVHWL